MNDEKRTSDHTNEAQEMLDRTGGTVEGTRGDLDDDVAGSINMGGFYPPTPAREGQTARGDVTHAFEAGDFDPPQTSSAESLKSMSEEAHARALRASSEARRLSEVAAALQMDAQARVDEANAEANKAHQKLIKSLLEVAVSKAAVKADEAQTARTEARDAAAKADQAQQESDAAAQQVTDLIDQQRPSDRSFRLEGGGWMESDGALVPNSPGVRGVDGRMYDHVSDHPSGDWIYR